MTIRSVEQWEEILGDLQAPEGENTERIVADRILADMIGYYRGSRHRQQDVAQLANAMIAFAKLTEGVLWQT